MGESPLLFLARGKHCCVIPGYLYGVSIKSRIKWSVLKPHTTATRMTMDVSRCGIGSWELGCVLLDRMLIMSDVTLNLLHEGALKVTYERELTCTSVEGNVARAPER